MGYAEDIEAHLRAPRDVAGVTLPDEFVLPAYDGHSLANVSSTVLRHFGAEPVPTAPLHADVTGGLLEGATKVVVILLDALGYLAAREQMASDPDIPLNRMAARGRCVPLTSIFPSTTAAALSTLHTALPPAGHGITGYRVYFPDRGLLANMIKLGGETDGAMNGLIPTDEAARRLLGVPTVHQRLAKVGVSSTCLLRREIVESGLSLMLNADATERVPFITPADLFVQLRKRVSSDPDAPACFWAYWDALDTSLHEYGVGEEEGFAEIRSFTEVLQRELLGPLEADGRGDVAVILTADHGQIQVGEDDIVPVREVEGLTDALAAPPAGTGRTGYLYLRRGVPDGPRALQAAFGDRAAVVDSRSALEAGLWGKGPIKAETGSRIGDCVSLMTGTRALFYPYTEGAEPRHLVGGRHGGLHEREMLTPFFIARY